MVYDRPMSYGQQAKAIPFSWNEILLPNQEGEIFDRVRPDFNVEQMISEALIPLVQCVCVLLEYSFTKSMIFSKNFIFFIS